MIVKNSYGEVTLDIPNSENSVIAISLSGGSDSAMLLHLLVPLLEAKKCKWKIVTGGDTARPWTGPAARKIAKLVLEHHGLTYTSIVHRFYGYNTTMLSEANAQASGVGKLVLENEFDYLISGTTALPDEHIDVPGFPIEREQNELYVEHNIMVLPNGDVCDRDNRNAGTPTGTILKQWRPLSFVHKKWLAAEYEKLMEEYPEYGDLLFNSTISCVSYAEHTQDFTRPCTYCWWCQEKKWAYGCYDAGYRD
jgi:hypothetical protein